MADIFNTDNFSKLSKHHIKSSIEVFSDLIQYESRNLGEFVSQGKITKHMKSESDKLLRGNKLVLNGGNRYTSYYRDVECSIDTLAKTCSCLKFIDKGICKHLVAACVLDNIELKEDEDESIIPDEDQHYNDNNHVVRVTRAKVQIKDKVNGSNKGMLNEDENLVRKKRGRPAKIRGALSLDESESQKKN
ncbi:unnamed protein product [Brachionus calyciflorus]|uniref:SWIM-type domain-containing protein n=1 Tax=Brachionus calyciflorus TaxID=104777 RepID=A0A813PT50_9BILA|nr:unnamed protein product [Brachionus calyciflorus]